jgi:hypothetical protein
VYNATTLGYESVCVVHISKPLNIFTSGTGSSDFNIRFFVGLEILQPTSNRDKKNQLRTLHIMSPPDLFISLLVYNRLILLIIL